MGFLGIRPGVTNMRQRYIVMMQRDFGWQQMGQTFFSLESARTALNEFKRGPDIDATFRIFCEVE
jgi:hypothetical protein